MRIQTVLTGLVLTAVAVAIAYFSNEGKMAFDVWGIPLLVFGGAIVFGVAASLTLQRDENDAKAVEKASILKDLHGRRAEALEALSVLQSQQHLMAPADYQREQKALLAVGAQAMRELDQVNGSNTPAPDNNLATSIQALTAALERGDIDAATYATSVAAITKASGAAASPSTPPTPSASSAPAPAPAPVVPQAPPPATAAPAQPGMSPAWQGAMWAVGGIIVIGAILWGLTSTSEPRRDGASMTGDQSLGSAPKATTGNVQGKTPGPGSEQAYLAALLENTKKELEQDPNNLELLNKATQLTLNDVKAAWGYNERARKVAPDDPEALVFEAVITMIIGESDSSLEKFGKLVTRFPENSMVHTYQGLTLMQLGRFAEAVPPLEKAVSLGVNDRQIMNALTVAKAGGPQNMAAPTTAPPPGTATGVLVSGTINIDPGRASFAGKTLFVSLSTPERPRPPLASIKLPPGPYPLEFQVTVADLIAMGGTAPSVPDSFVVKMRLDDDGNAFTQQPSDPQAVQKDVQRGTKGLSVTLK